MIAASVVGLGLLTLGLRSRGEVAGADEAAIEDRDEPPANAEPEPPPLPGTAAAGSYDTPPELRPRVTLSGEIDEHATLHCDRNYVLTFNTRVAPGATLTIEPGTVVLGDRETKGALIIEPGARLIAEGTRERPIVFTSSRAPGERAPGDWGELILLRGVALVDQPGAEPEGDDPGADDDAGFDELAWLAERARARVELSARVHEGGAAIDCGAPTGVIPHTRITATTSRDEPLGPPDDGFFDPEATWLGAFADPEGDWTDGWVVWTE